jgi:hypothetical protein
VRIKFAWDQPPNNGGATVIDYDIFYDQGQAVGNYVLLEEAVVN